MQLSDRSGISCDLCGVNYRQDFTYYSFDFRPVTVVDNRRPSLDMIFSTTVSSSLDVCGACFKQITDTVITHNKSQMSDKRRQQIHVNCELTGNKLIGSYTYYYCCVATVHVQMAGQPNVCVKCKTPTHTEDKTCQKCGHNQFIKPASVHMDQRSVEFNVCEEGFATLREKAENVRKLAGQWSTRS